MDELPTLQEMLTETIHTYCAQRGLGFPPGFIYCVAHIDADGEKVMTIGEDTDQLTAFSLGMAEYLKQTFKMDAEFELSVFAVGDDD